MKRVSFIKLYGLIFMACMQASPFTNAAAQTEPFIQDLQEEMNRGLDDVNDYRVVLEEIDEAKTRPVDLNSAGEEDIRRIPFLNDFQRRNLQVYLRDYGEAFSVYELLAVEGFDTILVRKISPYICFRPISHSPPLTLSNLLHYGRHELVVKAGTEFPRHSGYYTAPSPGEPCYYPGSPYGISFRYTYSYGDRLKVGFSGDKDPGEQFFAGGQKNGMDYYSGYLCFSSGKLLRRLIVGTFRAGWGLGLTFNNGGSYGMYPGFNPETAPGGGIRPTQSVSEGGVLRGAAFSLGAGRFTLSAMASFRKRDAGLITADSVGSTAVFSSFTETGYHRTENELSKAGRVSETIYGGNLCYRGKFFSAGITAYSVSLGASLEPAARPYNTFAFRGTYNHVFGADFNIFYRFFRVSGEISRSASGSLAWIAAISINPDPRLSVNLIYREYPPGYQNLYANCFRQNSVCSNEKAWFISFTASLPWRLAISLFTDFCNYPWLKYTVSRPSSGNDFGLMLNWQANRNLDMSLRYVLSVSETNVAGEDGVLPEAAGTQTSSCRLQMNWNVSAVVNIRTRVEIRRAKITGQQAAEGWLLYQDLALGPARLPFKVILRYAVFDCPSYASRIWAYEPDVLYGYSMPVFYGQGSRAGLLVKCRTGRHVSLWLKAAYTRYYDREVTGSGPEMVVGANRLELTAEVQLKI